MQYLRKNGSVLYILLNVSQHCANALSASNLNAEFAPFEQLGGKLLCGRLQIADLSSPTLKLESSARL
jgi:hypothetical protein